MITSPQRFLANIKLFDSIRLFPSRLENNQQKKNGQRIKKPLLRNAHFKSIKSVGRGEAMAIVEVNVVPMGTSSPSISSYIADCYNLAKKEAGIKHQITPMSTILEGDLDQLMDVVKKMHKIPFGDGVQRVVTSITIDERKDKATSMEARVDAVT